MKYQNYSDHNLLICAQIISSFLGKLEMTSINLYHLVGTLKLYFILLIKFSFIDLPFHMKNSTFFLKKYILILLIRIDLFVILNQIKTETFKNRT